MLLLLLLLLQLLQLTCTLTQALQFLLPLPVAVQQAWPHTPRQRLIILRLAILIIRLDGDLPMLLERTEHGLEGGLQLLLLRRQTVPTSRRPQPHSYRIHELDVK